MQRILKNLFIFNYFILFFLKEFPQFSHLNLKPGGFHRAPLCIQEFFYFYSEWQALATIRQVLMSSTTSSAPLVRVADVAARVANSTHRFIIEILKRELFGLNAYMHLKTAYTVVIIPYLNRQNNLINLMANLHPFLQRQFINYFILVAEQ